MLPNRSFYFVRHGQTDYNLNNLCAGGRTDVPLNSTGQKQAQALKQVIQSLNISKVICSPMIRTIQTASLATDHNHIIEHDIRECDIGDFEGIPVQQLIEYENTNPTHLPYPNGESKIELAKRVINAVRKALLNHGDDILFVSHGMVYWALLETLDIPFHYISNGALIQFESLESGWAVSKLSHLEQ